MHERSLARAILQQATQVCRGHGSARLREVCLQLGPLSGIEPCLLVSAFHDIASEQDLGPIELTIEESRLIVQCRDCRLQTVLSQFDFQCSHCHSRRVTVVQGDQVLIQSIRIEQDLTESLGQP